MGKIKSGQEEKKPQTSIEFHRETAQTLKQIDNTYRELLNPFGKRFGFTSRELAALERAKNRLAVLRSIMDSDVIKENPQRPVKELSFYFSVPAEK